MEPRRRDRESFEVILRRFFREVQQSAVLTEAKKQRFFEKDRSRKLKRVIAQRKATRKRAARGY
jgi:ribosomal protein S21